ncbi:MAG TPA: TIR domain-containing protein, partial [Tepidisphaeraceae bacterium]|nr:TIR domain-containing protein [Tepidisphaeraceae bacterium]
HVPAELSNQTKPIKLLMHRSEAIKFIQTQIEKGNALREQKIRSATGLERAREQKLEWTQSTTVVLSKIFESDWVIEEYNAWKGKILPEFADLDRFIEHFYDEMDQRIGKLQAIIKKVETEPDMVRRKDLSHANVQSHSASHAVTQGPSLAATPRTTAPVTLAALDQPVPAPAPSMSGGVVTPRNEPSPSHVSRASTHSQPISHTQHPQRQQHTQPTPHTPHTQHTQHTQHSQHSQHSQHTQHTPAPIAQERPAPQQVVSHQPVSLSSMQHISSQQLSRVGVLILHERDEDVERALSQFVRRLGFELMLITESTEGIKSSIERLGQQTQIGFAMLLASAEDIAGAQSLDQPLSPAARRAAFDMGYCCGKLGPDRVCVLHISSAGLFHDENGVNYIPIDAAEGWQIQLAKQLKRSGLDVDLNKVLAG